MNGTGTHSLGTVLTAATVAAVVALGAGFVAGRMYALNSTLREDTTFVLTQQADGCRPSEPLQLRARHGHTVVWHITNNCPDAYFVKLTNFAPNNNGTPGTPQAVVDPKDPETHAAIQSGATVGLPAKVLDDVPYLDFKYDIQLKGTAAGSQYQTRRDPDIDIWP